ncbi:extracellular solute-binding protein [Streptococcus merionis]|uniref:Maltose/maltodextrin ABC transporter, substrate binding periplasmic protein MalE n=2 Tax=Streptococcus merionis TaxID=400065 RepID=A0A239SWU4_9STRE|nr:extracellular solute-binding protein [Streptococcus merionis]SNU89204.1 Maltose/maltodextrin ABC transporter, substrate binding periplasmic protein MalE [Streptococcus merionis]
MTKWSKLAMSGLALVSAATLAACGSGKSSESGSSNAASGEVKLKLWVPTDAKESYTETVKSFEAANKGVSVEVIESNDSKAQENVKKDPESAADVFSLPHDQLGQLIESGVIQEIPEDYAKKVAADNVENAVAGAQYKGKTYAFPFGVESQVLMYNKDLLSEEDVKSYETITTKATFGATFKEMNAYATGPMMLSVGNTLFGEDGEDPKGTNWANEAGVSVLQWIADQNNNKGFVNLDPSNVISEFGAGKVAAFESGPWDYPAAVDALGKDKVGVAAYPTVKIGDKEVQQKAFMGVKLYAVNQAPAGDNVDRIAAAYALAAHLTNAESQANQFEKRSIVPSNKEAQASDAVTSDQLAQAVTKMTSSRDYTVVMPKLSEMSFFWTEAQALLADVYNGKISPSDYMARLQQFDQDVAGK